MKKISILVFLILFISLTSCIEMIKGAAKSINESSHLEKESLSSSDYTTVDVENLYQLDVPKYMKEMPSLHPEASLKYANIYKEVYSVVIHENKEQFIDVFKELDEYDSELSPVENYTNVQKKMYSERMENIQMEDYGLVEINGYPARQIKISGFVEGTEISYVIAFIEGSENIFMLMNWTSKVQFNRYETMFEFINGTFKLI